MLVSYMIFAVKRALCLRNASFMAVRRALGALVIFGILNNAPYAQQPPPNESAGEVVFVAGSATRQTVNSAPQAIAKGLKLVQGDVLRTDEKAYVYVRMSDGGLLVLRPQSHLRIDHWRYNAERPELSEIKYTLNSGVARYVSGRGSQAAKDKFRFNTTLAAIGVRGTDFTVLSNPDLTQVSVRSGGVIVGSLGNGCSAETLGPCEGERALELFATSSNKLLQVTLGDRRPQLVDSASAGGPDKARPPASGEPHADSGSSVPAGVLATEGSREAAVIDLATKSGNPDATTPSIAVWGRWGALTNGQSGAEVVRDVLNGRQLAAINRYYVIGANPSVVQEMPNAGVGQFKLTGHSGLLVDPATGKFQETTASNGSLQIDFGARRFQTNLDLQSSTVQTTIRSQGYIEAGGKMASDAYVSGTALEGLVGGKGGSEAIYIYHRSAAQGIEVSGVASWKK